MITAHHQIYFIVAFSLSFIALDDGAFDEKLLFASENPSYLEFGSFWYFLGKFDEVARNNLLKWAEKAGLTDSFKVGGFWSFLGKFDEKAREKRLSAVTSFFEKCMTSKGPFKAALQGYAEFWTFFSDTEFTAKAKLLAKYADV